MRISVKVKANSKEERVEKVSDKEYVLRVKAPAKEGRANEAVVELLSEYLDIPKSRLIIVRGHASKNKIIEMRLLKKPY